MLRPMVVVYRLSWLTYLVGRLLVRIAHFALVNILAGRGLVPELLQGEATPERMAAEIERLLGDRAAREEQLRGLREVRDSLEHVGRLNDGTELTYGLGVNAERWRGVRRVSHTGSTGGYRAALMRFPDQNVAGTEGDVVRQRVRDGRVAPNLTAIISGRPGVDRALQPVDGTDRVEHSKRRFHARPICLTRSPSLIRSRAVEGISYSASCLTS